LFDSTLDSWVGAAGVLSVLSLVAGPALVVLIFMGYWKRRGKPANPLLFSAIPMALTTVSIGLLAASLETNRLFQQSGSMGGPGYLRPAADALINSRQSLMWRVIECAACIVIAAVFQMMIRHPAKAVPSDALPGKSISMGIALCLIAVTLGAGVLVWLYSDLLRFFILIVSPIDAATAAEARARLGNMGIGDVAHFLASRVNMVGASSILLTLVLPALGWQFSKNGRKHPVRRRDVTASALLCLFVLGCCGIGVAGMAREIDFLRILELSPSLRPKVQTPPGSGPNGWAVGELNTIMRRSDGGADWLQQRWVRDEPVARSTLWMSNSLTQRTAGLWAGMAFTPRARGSTKH